MNLNVKLFAYCASLLMSLFLLSACQWKKASIGSSKNPLKFYFVPSVEGPVLDNGAIKLKEFLEKKTSYHFQIAIPTSYVAVVEALGSERADIASLNTFGYIIVHEKYGTEARLMSLRQGAATYKGQIIVRDKDPIYKVQDLNGKRFAFVDPISTSGYLLPAKLIKEQKINLGTTVFAHSHDNVINMLLQGQVDAGATFYFPPQNGTIQDARNLVKKYHPKIEKDIRVLTLTDSLPNAPLVFRKGIPEDIKQKVCKALKVFSSLPEGQEVLKSIGGVSGFRDASDKDYDVVRQLIKQLKFQAQDLLPKK